MGSLIIDDLETRLIDKGVCSGRGVDLFKNRAAKIPEGPGPYLTLVGIGGSIPERRNGTSPFYGKPSAHITVRAATSTIAKEKILEAMSVCDVNNEIIGGTFYLWIRPNTSEPQELEPDERGRPRFTFALTAMGRPTTTQ
jgi:hypothetical protein